MAMPSCFQLPPWKMSTSQSHHHVIQLLFMVRIGPELGQKWVRIGPICDSVLFYHKWTSRKVWKKQFGGGTTTERLRGSLSKVIAAGD